MLEVLPLGDYEVRFEERENDVAFLAKEVAGNIDMKTMINRFHDYFGDLGKWESIIKLARDFAVDSGLVRDAGEKPTPGTAKDYIITPAKEQQSDSYQGTIRLSPEERRRRSGGSLGKLPPSEIYSLAKNIEKWRNLRNLLGTIIPAPTDKHTDQAPSSSAGTV